MFRTNVQFLFVVNIFFGYKDNIFEFKRVTGRSPPPLVTSTKRLELRITVFEFMTGSGRSPLPLVTSTKKIRIVNYRY